VGVGAITASIKPDGQVRARDVRGHLFDDQHRGTSAHAGVICAVVPRQNREGPP
jgi:hypothetical protein